LYAAKGEELLAEQAVAATLELQPDERIVYNALSRNHDMLGNTDAAEAWAYKALAVDDTYAQTWLSLGSVAEARGESTGAIKLYEEAARLANEQGSDALYVLARMRMGMLMGGGGSGPSGAGF
jgi:tetratricopeptide (TPR) repeat protein